MSQKTGMNRDQIAKCIAREIKDNFVVNLGIGMPTLVANHIPSNMFVMLQSENGLLGIGPFPKKENVDPDLINAGKQTVTATKGASYFSSADSFAMIRGGHVDLTILGAMDLVAGARRVIVAMIHNDKSGASKLLKKCTLPLTGVGCVDRIVTDLGVIDVTNEGFVLREYAPGLTPEDAVKATDAPLRIAPDVSELRF